MPTDISYYEYDDYYADDYLPIRLSISVETQLDHELLNRLQYPGWVDADAAPITQQLHRTLSRVHDSLQIQVADNWRAK